MQHHDRRAFLKLFGIGATAVPLIGGLPAIDKAARIVEPPTVEPAHLLYRAGLAALPDLEMACRTSPNETAHVQAFFTKEDGSRWFLEAKSLIVSTRLEAKSLAGYGGFPMEVTAARRMVWEMRGEFIADANGVLAKLGELAR